MRVLLVSHNFVTEWRGGVEVYTHDLAHALRRRGVDVSVLYTVPSTKETGLVERVEHGLHVIRVETNGGDAYGLAAPDPQMEALFENVASRYDVVHFQHTWALLPFAVVECARRAGARVALTLHDAWFICARTHLQTPGSSDVCAGPETDAKCASCLIHDAPAPVPDPAAVESLLAERRIRSARALAACDRITAPSRFLIERFQRAGVVAPIEHETLGIVPVAAARRTRPDYKVFALLGALSSLKNAAALVRAFRATPGAAGLWIFGEGPERRAIEALVAADPRIELFGGYDAEDLPEILSRVDALVMPSLFENYPLVLREALSAGVPVLASNVGGIPEIVEHQVNGLLFDPSDDASIARALERVLEEPDLLPRLHAGIRPPKTLDEDAARWCAWYETAEPERNLQVRERGPAVSIVVPVYNRCDLTRACLDALGTTRNRTDFELIVSDDGSSDETRHFLSQLGEHVRVVRSDANRGFAHACNAGEAEARGDVVVFLNNDTLPRDGWLDPLVDEAKHDESVGIVGSRLLYPDGTVQHAGVVFGKLGGWPYHMLRGCPGDSLAVTRRRELRAVTGACMLVRRTSFRALGGFDTAFRNGFEDVDLCLRVSARGEKVVYRPDSVLVHGESQTPGRRTHERENQRVYLARWGQVWRADEDWVLDDARLGVHAMQQGDQLVPTAFTRDTPGSPPHWERVVAIQAAIARGDREQVRTALNERAPWPPEVLALYWGVHVAEWAGADDARLALARRLEGVGLNLPGSDTSARRRSSGAFPPVF